MARRNYNRRRRYSHYREPNFIAMLILLAIFAIIWIYAVIILPFIEWVRQNILLLFIYFILIFIICMGGYTLYRNYKKKKEIEKQIERQAFKEKQIAKGLVKFVDRFRIEKWGKPDEVEVWEKEDAQAKEKDKLINQIVETMQNFNPTMPYKNEFPYQIELIGYLKSKFPTAEIEQQRGSSRPDIVIKNIAIEIKGPTRDQDLQTVADKCMRYHQHFEEIIVVLFETNVYERRYKEWEKGMHNTFPHVRIIKK